VHCQKISNALGTLGQSPGKKKRFELTFKTVLVALFTERVGQQVPDCRTSNRKGPTAECRLSVECYVHQLSSCRSKMLSARDIGDGRTTAFEILWSGAILTAVHQHAELILDALRHIKPMEVLVQ